MFTPPAQTKWSVCSTGILLWSFALSATFGCVFGSPELNSKSSVLTVLSSKRRIFAKRFATPAILRRRLLFWGELVGEELVWPEERERERNIGKYAALCCVKRWQIQKKVSTGVRYLILTCVAEFISPSISAQAMYCTSIQAVCTIVQLTGYRYKEKKLERLTLDKSDCKYRHPSHCSRRLPLNFTVKILNIALHTSLLDDSDKNSWTWIVQTISLKRSQSTTYITYSSSQRVCYQGVITHNF